MSQSNAANFVKMESGKFLKLLNLGSQSKVKLFEDHIRKLGQQAGKDWKLASLSENRLVIEENAGNYLIASYTRDKGGSYTVSNVKPIKIVENKKKANFENTCRQLVEAIEKEDQKLIASSLTRWRHSASAIAWSPSLASSKRKTASRVRSILNRPCFRKTSSVNSLTSSLNLALTE
jgi:hypothetical protein